MSIVSVPYEEFITSNQALVSSGGPWLSTSTDLPDQQAQCLSGMDVGCDGYCLLCQVFPPDSMPAYHPSFNANVSVNLAKYGGATNLDFTWTYWPVYCGTNVTAGSSIPIHSEIGDAAFDDAFPAVDYYTYFHGGHQWDSASKISHSGSTSVLLGSQSGVGYIALKINITMTPLTTSHEEYLNYYVKDIAFTITAPQQNSTSTVTPGSSSSSSSTTASSSTAALYSTNPSSSTTAPVGVVAGATIGAVALIALLVIGFLLRRRQQRENADRTSFTEPVKPVDALPNEGGVLTPVAWVVPDSAPLPASAVGKPERNGRPNIPGFRQYSSGKVLSFLNRPDSVTTSGDGSLGVEMAQNPGGATQPPLTPPPLLLYPFDPPPTYGSEDLLRQDRVPASLSCPELARFASAHRDVITEHLEARLQAAGYLPTDDPSRLTAEEWKNEYGITKLELRRLQDLYSRSR